MAKYQSFTFSISPSNEYSALISFRIDRFETHWGFSKDPGSKAWVRKELSCIIYWFGIQHPSFTTGPLWVQTLRSTQKWLSFGQLLKENPAFPVHLFLCLL